jgi:hypothetical protein
MAFEKVRIRSGHLLSMLRFRTGFIWVDLNMDQDFDPFSVTYRSGISALKLSGRNYV